MELNKIIAAVTALTIVGGASAVYNRLPESCPFTVYAGIDENGIEYIQGTYENLKYRKYDDHIEISGCDSSAEGEVVIPAELEGLPVTAIGVRAFKGCEGLTSVIIPEGVTKIGDFAFRECAGLKSVTIPDSVTNICDYAFSYCYTMKSVTLPAGLKDFDGYGVFYQCRSLNSVTLPESLTDLGDGTFAYCSNLTSIDIPESVTRIGNDTFRSCVKLASLTIPETVTDIGAETFTGTLWFDENFADEPFAVVNDILIYAAPKLCTGSVTVPDGVKIINHIAFFNCFEMTSVNIPASVTAIGNSAFQRCTGLTSIVIPETVAEIGGYVFDECTGLETVDIMNKDMMIGPKAFWDTPWLEAQLTDKMYVVVNGTLIDANPELCTDSITIPDDVTGICSAAFYKCKNLTSVTVPNSVKYIGKNSFNPALEDIYYVGTKEEWDTITMLENERIHSIVSNSTLAYTVFDDFTAEVHFTVPSTTTTTTTTTSTTTTTTTTTTTATTTSVSTSVTTTAPPDVNILYGDANCDNEVSMADAVLIMQAQANPDKYGVGGSDENAMTEQGRLNGDCYDPGSGITANDALSIQKYMLNLIPELPEEK